MASHAVFAEFAQILVRVWQYKYYSLNYDDECFGISAPHKS